MRICNRCHRAKSFGNYTQSKTVCDDCTRDNPPMKRGQNYWEKYKLGPRREPSKITAESVLPEPD